jgi:inactive STAND/Effector-associated domain 9
MNEERSPREIEQKAKKNEYAQLAAKYELLCEQIAGELNEDNKVTLRTRLHTIKKQMDEIWGQMNQGQLQTKDSRLQSSTFTDNLPLIDFKEVMDTITSLLECLKKDRGDALLIIQDNLSMSGDLFLRRISDQFKKQTTDFKPYELDFYLSESLNEYGWLEQLGKFFGLETKSDPEELASLMIEKICKSVRSGSFILLKIHKWDDVSCQKTTLTWFINNFWLPLVRCLEDKHKYPQVKFVAMVVVEAALSPDCFNLPCLCEVSEKSSFRWLNLPLRNWQEDEILVWLQTFSGIEDNDHSIRLSKRIFNSSRKGVPQLVSTALAQELILDRYHQGQSS